MCDTNRNVDNYAYLDPDANSSSYANTYGNLKSYDANSYRNANVNPDSNDVAGHAHCARSYTYCNSDPKSDADCYPKYSYSPHIPGRSNSCGWQHLLSWQRGNRFNNTG